VWSRDSARGKWALLIAIIVVQFFHKDSVVLAQIFDERFEDWPIDLKIPGTLVVADDDGMSSNHLRKLLGDTTQLVNRYPQLLGIGIDQSTAIVVEKSVATVQGNGNVHFYDRSQKVYPDRPDYISLSDGQSYELIERRLLENP